MDFLLEDALDDAWIECAMCVFFCGNFDGFFFVKDEWILLWKIEWLICDNMVNLFMGGVGFASRFVFVAITFFIPSSMFSVSSFFYMYNGCNCYALSFFVTNTIWQQSTLY